MKKQLFLPLLYFMAGTAIVKGQVVATPPQTPWVLEGNTINVNPGGSSGSNMMGDFFGSNNNAPLRFFIFNDLPPYSNSTSTPPVLRMDQYYNTISGFHSTLLPGGLNGSHSTIHGYENTVNVFGTGLNYSHALGNSNLFNADPGLQYSFLLGNSNQSTKDYNFSIGNSNVNSGDHAYIFGESNTASNSANSTLLGSGNTSNASFNFSAGNSNSNNGDRSFALGEGNSISGMYSYALGLGNQSFNNNNYSIGGGNSNSAQGAMLFGSANSAYASATNSFLFGNNNLADNINNFTMGLNNTNAAAYSYIFGEGNTTDASSNASMIMGTNSAAGSSSNHGLAGGNFVKTDAENTFVFGTGVSSGDMLTNDIGNSFIVGFNSARTLFVGPDAAAGITAVGIGTTAPVALFHTNGESSFGTYAARPAYQGLVNFNTEGFSNGVVIENNGLAAPGSKASIKMDKVGSGPNGLHFSMTHNAFTLSKTAMFLAHNGKVGFGMTNPAADIHTEGQVAIGEYASMPAYAGALNINSGNIIIEREQTGWSNFKAKIGISTYSAGRNGLRFNMTRDGFTGSSGDPSWGTEALFLAGDGMVGIGNTNPLSKLHVTGDFCVSNTSGVVNFKVNTAGYVHARDILVDNAGIPDYVFKKDYKLLSINEYEKFIEQNSHLPNVPSEAEYGKRGGVAVGELELKLLEKVEEQALYIIQLNKRLELLEKQLSDK